MNLRIGRFSKTIVVINTIVLVSSDVATGSWWSFGGNNDDDNTGKIVNDNGDDDTASLLHDIEAFHDPHVKVHEPAHENIVERVAEEVEEELPVEPASAPIEYGVDVSFPMHHAKVSDNFAWLKHNTDPAHYETPKQLEGKPVSPLAGRQDFYDNFLQGCVKHYGSKGKACIQTENDRIAMSLRQPQSMQNYTENGFKKIKAPKELFKLILDFWEVNKDKQAKEQWGGGNTYTNNWDTPTYMVSVEDTKLRGGGYQLKQKIWDAAHTTISEWTGQELTQCSLYGIRIYRTDAILAPHVDRLPLVSSAIINVDSDLDEPWPLEVIGHDGRAVNVTMEPGDMVLYESHSVIHGRPFPLKGRYVANLFVHFEPTGHSLRHEVANSAPEIQDVHEKYRKAVENGVGGHESDHSGLPPYLIPGTPEESYYRRTHPSGQKNRNSQFETGSTALHKAAQQGDIDTVKKHLENGKHVDTMDRNGWTALHEASRGGHTDVVKLLLETGADVNFSTGNGETPLYWAKKVHGEDHPVVELLMSNGGMEMGPEL